MQTTNSSTILGAFLAEVSERGAQNLAQAVDNLPADKRNWSPAATARTPAHVAAECATNNGIVAEVIATRKWVQFGDGQEAYFQRLKELAAGDWNELKELLAANTQKLVETLKSVSDEHLEIPVETPYGTWPLKNIMSYPYWNMGYHEGQTNYVGSILGL
jgi:hypothetical protein